MGGIHHTAGSCQHDPPAEDIGEAVWVVGTRYSLQAAEQNLPPVFTNGKADLSQHLFLAKRVLNVQEAELRFQAGGLGG